MNIASKQSNPEIEKLQGDLSLIDLDPDFGRLLKDKDVMIVGPAEVLLGTRQGKIIDSYDLVVRFNTSIQYMPFATSLAEDIGTRTDILYCNNEILTEGILGQTRVSHEGFREVCKAGIKYVVSTNNDYSFPGPDNSEPGGRHEYQAFKVFLEQQDIDIGFRMLYSTSAVGRKLLGGYIGRTGFLAILDLLAYDIRKLNIAGMTFYHKGGHLFLEDRISELHPMKDHLGREPKGDIKGHNSYRELELMRKLAFVYGSRLGVDEHLETLLAPSGTTEQTE